VIGSCEHSNKHKRQRTY